jgi:hypothetical protein
MMKFLLENVNRGWFYQEPDPDWRNKGVMRRFFQHQFLDTPIWDSHKYLSPLGYVFYPEQCYD